MVIINTDKIPVNWWFTIFKNTDIDMVTINYQWTDDIKLLVDKDFLKMDCDIHWLQQKSPFSSTNKVLNAARVFFGYPVVNAGSYELSLQTTW